MSEDLDEIAKLVELASSRLAKVSLELLGKYPGTELAADADKALHQVNALKYLRSLCRRMREQVEKR